MPFPVACIASPLTDERLSRYSSLIAALDRGEIKDALTECLACVAAWWQIPESTRQDVKRWEVAIPARDGAGEVVRNDRGAPIRRSAQLVETPLEAAQVEHLWDVTPWMRELNTLSTPAADGLFDALPAGELRDAAFDLLWHCKEITLDREPLTSDKLK